MKLKHFISTALILKTLFLSERSILTVEAFRSTFKALLEQNKDPVLYISRTLTDTERNYSNIKREALAAYWSSKRLENFLLGKQFTLKTDCKPSIYILSPSQALNQLFHPDY